MEDSQVQRHVGAAFAQLRSSKDLSPAALAREASVDVKTLRAFEAGERWPQDTTRSKIESALGLQLGTADDLRARLSPMADDNPHITRRARDILSRARVDIHWANPQPGDQASGDQTTAAADMAEQLRSLAVIIRQARNRAVHGTDITRAELVQAVVAADALVTVIVQNMDDALGPAALRNRAETPEPIEEDPWTLTTEPISVDNEPETMWAKQAARRGPGPTKGEQLRDRDAQIGEERQIDPNEED